eukprot:TRINITY_DN68542_c0_g1_i1.p1 TRINITY_DN68542_c0_g1~~TRINITY_DN68542_c0_g1_i1.p1  ORF type:complete len:755 (-),score=109.83 TRINITY_DN68542_c0_g1_i1:126-2390(-)
MSRASAEAQRWAAERRAAAARAEVLRAERAAARRSSETDVTVPQDPSERHLPSCLCRQCASTRAQALPAEQPYAPSHLEPGGEAAGYGPLGSADDHRGVPSTSIEPSSRGAGWDSDFTEGCRHGFDALAQERRLAEQRVARKRQQRQQRARSASCEDRGRASGRHVSEGDGVVLNRAGDPARVRPVAAAAANADEGPSSRINFDKRTSRHMHAIHFKAAIASFRSHVEVPDVPECSGRVRFFARKRPLFGDELSSGEFDVVTVAGRFAIVHVCGMAPDLHRMHVKHCHFPCAEAFGEHATNEDLHRAAMAPLVAHALAGGKSTCLMYGATGSGKTFTMTAMQQLAAPQLCSSGSVTLMMLELAGKDVRDLLAVGANGSQTAITLRDNDDGDLDLVGASVHTCDDESQLMEFLASGQRRRKTSGTLANAVSSRSHMVCILGLVGGGSLVLVDCAGSERKEDSARHTAERQREGADINASLLALKECIRALTSGAQHVPFRMHGLTRVLRDSFVRPGAKLHVVATVAPGASDAEHSVATLRMACGLCASSDDIYERKEDVRPVPQGNVAPSSATKEPVLSAQSGIPTNRSRDPALPDRQVKDRDSTSGAQAARPSSVARRCSSASRRSTGGRPSDAVCTRQDVARRRVSDCGLGAAGCRPRSNAEQPPSVTGSTLVHPSKWTVDELQSWLQQHRLAAKLPPSADSKTVLRWNVKRWVEALGGDERAGLRAFNGLRLEIDRIADEETRRRKGIMRGR